MNNRAQQDAATLRTYDDDAFRRYLVDANTAYTASRDSHSAAARRHGEALTEQICRHLETIRPDAEWLSVKVEARYHLNPDGTRNPHCQGHDPVMVPGSVLATNHTRLADLDALDPIRFWLERLSEVIDPQAMVLRVPRRIFEFSYETDMDNTLTVRVHENDLFDTPQD